MSASILILPPFLPGQVELDEGDFYSAEDVPFAVIASDYESFTGMRVIRDNAAAGMTFSVNFAGLEPGEAADLIERTLLLNGIALVPAGANSVKAIAVQGGLRPSAEGAPLILDPDQLPDGEQMVTFLMPLRNHIPTPPSSIRQIAVPSEADGTQCLTDVCGGLTTADGRPTPTVSGVDRWQLGGPGHSCGGDARAG